MENKKDDFSNIDILSMLVWIFISIIFVASFNSTLIPKAYSEQFTSIIIYLTILAWLINNFKKNNIKNSLVYGKIENYNKLFISLVVSIIICIVSVFIFIEVFSILSRMNINILKNTQVTQSDSLDAPAIIDIIVTITIAPLVEELFFRGYLLNKLSERYKVGTSLMISTLIFSLVHLKRFWMVLLLGIFLSIVYIRTRSLLISIICHSAYNSFVYILFFHLSDNDFQKLLPYSSSVLIVSIPLIIYYFHRIWPNSNDLSPYEYNKANL